MWATGSGCKSLSTNHGQLPKTRSAFLSLIPQHVQIGGEVVNVAHGAIQGAFSELAGGGGAGQPGASPFVAHEEDGAVEALGHAEHRGRGPPPVADNLQWSL